MRKGVWTVLFLLCAIGCRKQDAEEVWVRIGEREITSGTVRQALLVQARMAELAGTPIPKDQLPAWGNSQVLRVIPGLISAELLEQEIHRLGESADEEDVRRTLDQYNKTARQSAKTVDDLARLFGDLETEFRRQFDRSALFAAYARRHPVAAVTTDDIAAFYAARTNQLKVAKQIDAKAHEKAEAAWKRLKAGEAWEKVASACSEDKLVDEENAEFASDWATVGIDGFGYPELAKALLTLEVGQFSRPVETEEGLMIVKVMELAGENKTLGRILFRMAQPVDFPAEEDVRKQIAAERANSSALDLQRRLREKVKITYPQGSNHVYRVWAETSASDAHIK